MAGQNIMERIQLTNIQRYHITDTDVVCLQSLAQLYGIKTILLSPASCDIAQKGMKESIKLGVSIAYPSGAFLKEIKEEEIADIENKWKDVCAYYVTPALGLFLGGEEETLRSEMGAAVYAAAGKDVFFFMEAAIMTDDQIHIFCQCARESGVKGVISSTGFTAYDIPAPTKEDVVRIKTNARDLLIFAWKRGKASEEEIGELLNVGADEVIVETIETLI
jgi:deoxyribose-phosphate aldolase